MFYLDIILLSYRSDGTYMNDLNHFDFLAGVYARCIGNQ
jgi:hypothetical protein